MGLLGPAFTPRRWERARAVVEEHLGQATGGLSTIALVDRLTLGGFREEEAMAILHQLKEEQELALVSGRWTLARASGPRP